ncbi:NAD(P)-dependent oxidoreductase [Yinghuangia sp. YIM S10712]|uniref:NAD(P)-dependent oxidoreductase n=1 Tax=Yinghuangia sp. YIM S10712 TaxID=3436930 RepID=UPI003F529E6A
MSRIVVFGAGGRAGRRVVAEVVARGHAVTAVVRDPAKYADLAADRVDVVTGDILDAGSVAAVVAGHDAVVNAAYQADKAPADFFGGAARALIAGLASARVERLVVIGIGTCLEVQPGVAVHDTPGFPEEGRTFSLGHQAELDVLRAEGDGVDWLVLAPPPVVLDAEAERTGKYRIGGPALLPHEGEGEQTFSYADVAVAVVDEIETPKHHRVLAAIA